MSTPPAQTLHQQIQDLHRVLDDIDTQALDGESRQALSVLFADISRVLGDAGTPPDQPQLIEHLEAQAVRFEAEHPTLSTGMRKLLDALAKAGI